jgi:hypothetical protein
MISTVNYNIESQTKIFKNFKIWINLILTMQINLIKNYQIHKINKIIE